MGLVLTIAPWTLYWERNYFLSSLRPLREIVLSPWLRGAVSAIGVLTIGAGLLDLLAAIVRPRPSRPESAGTAG